MNEKTFDRIAHQLAAGAESRRGLVRRLAAAALAAPLALPGTEAAAGDRRQRRCRKRKRIGQKCLRRDGSECRCRGGARCRGRRCRCPNGRQESGGVCARRPICLPALEPCQVDADCCSRSCVQDLVRVCVSSLEGERCLTTGDCLNAPFTDPLRCRGFRCLPA